MPGLQLSRLRRRDVLGPAAFVIATGALVLILGVPYKRDALAIWLLGGLLCFSLTDLRGCVRGIVLDWLPFIAILIAYDSLRGSAAHGFGVHYLPQLQVDRWMFGGTAPTTTLQHWLWHGHVVWYDVIFWAIYLTHFFATPLLAAILWKLDRDRFRRFAVLVAGLCFAGLITYVLYPAAPPWLAAQHGLMSPLTRVIPLVWPHVGLHSAGSVAESGYKFANDVAAVPSLHAAFSLLVAVTVWPRRRRWLGPLVVAYPLAMALTLVYGGEHYVSDILLGWAYAGSVVLLGGVLRHRWELRSRERLVAVEVPGAGRALPEPSV